MIFKEDWEKAKERFSAFWAGEIVDRCCLSVTAPRRKPIDSGYEYREAKDNVQKWIDSEFRMEQTMNYFANTFFGGEAIPLYWNNLGPGVAASFMGSGYKLAENTVWFDVNPPITDWGKRKELKLDLDSEMWKIAWNMTEKFCKDARGNYHVGITDLGGNMDIAVSLRGNDILLYDLYDNPDEVKKLLDEIDAVWFQAYEKLQSLINSHMDGCTAWMGLWNPKRWFPLQCDFSAMISPEMFDEFVKTHLEKEANFLDNAIYHLDGPAQINHLESLLEIDGITGIQCVPGDKLSERTGRFHSTYFDETWLPVYKRIQEKGKRLILDNVQTVEIDDLMECLSPKGLFIATHCNSQDEAEELLKKFEKYY